MSAAAHSQTFSHPYPSISPAALTGTHTKTIWPRAGVAKSLNSLLPSLAAASMSANFRSCWTCEAGEPL